jgi:hypothetical protein
MDKEDKQDISEISDQIQKKNQKNCRIWLETIPNILNITCSQIKTRINHYKCRTVAWLILNCLCRNKKERKFLTDIKFYRTPEIERKFRKYRRLSAHKKTLPWTTSFPFRCLSTSFFFLSVGAGRPVVPLRCHPSDDDYDGDFFVPMVTWFCDFLVNKTYPSITLSLINGYIWNQHFYAKTVTVDLKSAVWSINSLWVHGPTQMKM